jgi:hypothetical protein
MRENTNPQSSTEPSTEDLLKVIEAALMCLDEGNKARAAQLLYSALPEERRQRR